MQVSMFSRLPETVARQARESGLASSLLAVSVGYREGPSTSIGYDVHRRAGECLLKYCLAGRGHISAGGNTFEVRPGDLAVLSAPLDHAYGTNAEEPWAVYWVYLTGTEVQSLLGMMVDALDTYAERKYRDSQGLGVMHLGLSAEVEDDFSRLCRCYDSGYGNLEILEAAARVRLLLCGLMGMGRRQHAGEAREGLAALAGWMGENLTRKVTLEELALRYGTGKDQFIRNFKAVYGYTPMDYFLRLRIQKAGELMVTRHLPVHQAALALGFEDPYYFSRIFAKKMGIPPREYCRRYG